MNPILHSLDRLIRMHGEATGNFLEYWVIPLGAWLLGWCAGRKKTKRYHTFVLMIRPRA